MTNATYAGLRMAARAGKPMPEKETMPEDEDEAEAEEAEAGKKPKGKKKDEYMTEDEANAAIAEATAKAKADERARFAAVMASDEYQGRESLAATLLANDKLSADEIVTALAAAPKAAAPAAPEPAADADDDKARAEMRDKLAAEQPGETGQAADDEPQADDSLVTNMKARYGLK